MGWNSNCFLEALGLVSRSQTHIFRDTNRMNEVFTRMSAGSIVTTSFRELSEKRKLVIPTAILFFIVPQLTVYLLSTYFGKEEVTKLFEASASGQAVNDLLDLTGQYLSKYFVAWMVSALLGIVGYMVILNVAVGTVTKEQDRVYSRYLRAGLRLALPKGILGALMIFALFLVAQLLTPPAIVLAILCTLAPVIIVHENKGVFASLGKSITLGFARREPGRAWSVFFIIMSIGAMVYLSSSLLFFLGEIVLNLDYWMPVKRDLWMIEIPGVRVGLMQGIVEVFWITGLAFIFSFLPFLTNSVYQAAQPRIRIRV